MGRRYSGFLFFLFTYIRYFFVFILVLQSCSPSTFYVLSYIKYGSTGCNVAIYSRCLFYFVWLWGAGGGGGRRAEGDMLQNPNCLKFLPFSQFSLPSIPWICFKGKRNSLATWKSLHINSAIETTDKKILKITRSCMNMVPCGGIIVFFQFDSFKTQEIAPKTDNSMWTSF